MAEGFMKSFDDTLEVFSRGDETFGLGASESSDGDERNRD
jgi:hypothetical protein